MCAWSGYFVFGPSARNKCGKNLHLQLRCEPSFVQHMVQTFVRVPRAKQLRPLMTSTGGEGKEGALLLQERRSFINREQEEHPPKVSHRWMFHASHALVQSAFFHGEIRRNREEVGSGLLTLDVRQRINGVTKNGDRCVCSALPSANPGNTRLSRDGDGLVVADFPAAIRR